MITIKGIYLDGCSQWLFKSLSRLLLSLVYDARADLVFKYLQDYWASNPADNFVGRFDAEKRDLHYLAASA